MRIAIIGRSQLLYRTAELFRDSGYDIALIVTAKEAPEYTRTAADFEKLAKDLDAQYIYTPKINLGKYRDQISQSGKIDLAVSINYTGVISDEIIDLFPLGILNAHAGDLPRYRGNAPLAWALINGEDRVGLCIHKMIGGELDSGNIFARSFYNISIDTRVGELFEWIEKDIPHLMLDAVNKIERDPTYKGEEQSKDPKDALRGYPRLPEDGKINWSNSAESIVRLINASSEPFGGAFCEYNGEKLIIWRAEVGGSIENYLAIPGQIVTLSALQSVEVICGIGKIKLTEIEVNAVRTREPKRFLNSVRHRLK
jgi:UDP-4-amino-4-deoxy-L-arabinose formyltransferase/UDP-glucuronic acid dehydrogenase (UDP-4-keto-hexauronic acid decarboxylating)